MEAGDARVRHVVFARLAETGAAPSPAAIASELSLSVSEAMAALRRLHDEHQLVLTPEGDAVRMAHPFSAAPMSFVLRSPVDDRLWWGGCAWDSFGIVAALAEELVITTRCPACGRTISFLCGPLKPPPSLSLRIPKRAAEWWDDVVHTCSNIRLFCDETHAKAHVRAEGLEGGQLVDAERMWRLAMTWYGDRLDPSYAPQTREQRQVQLAAAGLGGEFWQLP